MFFSLTSLAVLETLKTTLNRVFSVLAKLRPAPRPPTAPNDLAFNKMWRLRRRCDALVVHIKAGTLPPPRPVEPKTSRPAERPIRPRRPGPAPRRKGWLIAAFPEEAPIGPLLARWIDYDAGLQAAAAASPDANRLLRAILWAAGVNPPDKLPKLDRPKRRAAKPPATRDEIEAPPPDAVPLQPRPVQSPGPLRRRAQLRAASPQPPPPRRLPHRSRDPCQILPAETVTAPHAPFVSISKQIPRLGSRRGLR